MLSAPTATAVRRARRGRWAGQALAGWLMASLMLPSLAWADRPQWAFQTFPFAQQLNLDAVYEVTHSAPQDLLQAIRQHGVDIRRVRTEAPTRPLNPLLAAVPEADAELLRLADYQESYEGRVLCAALSCGRLTHDTILIRDTASTYTLLHEFVQALLRPVPPAVDDIELEARFGAAFRRLTLYQRRLYDDPYRLLNPLWRRDILAAQADVAADLFARIRIGQSQEAIVEGLLSRYIDERSPYFDAARRAQGRQYAEAMINNAIDVFNTVHDSTVFVRQAVDNLRAALQRQEIDLAEGARLSDDDVTTVMQSIAATSRQLARVRSEIQALKDFQAQ